MWFQERPLQKEIFNPLKSVTHLVEFIKSKIQPPVCKSAQRKKKKKAVKLFTGYSPMCC